MATGVPKIIVGNRKLAPLEVLQIAFQNATVVLDTAVLEKVRRHRRLGVPRDCLVLL